MPLKSKAQERYLWATNPEVARKFEGETPAGAKLPERITKKRRPATNTNTKRKSRHND